MALPQLLSARQAAKVLDCSKAYVCRLFSRGVIPAQKVDSDWVAEAKEVRKYLDDKRGIPVYYRDTSDWSRKDHYFLFRCLDKMMHDRRHRYDEEIAAIDADKLNVAASAMLVAMGAHERFANLAEVANVERIDPPLVLTEYPSGGAFPNFERVGVVL